MAGVEGYLLGLDVSTFCTGFSVWNLNENKFETAGHIPLKNVKDLHSRVDVVFNVLDELNNNTDKITEIVNKNFVLKWLKNGVQYEKIMPTEKFITVSMKFVVLGMENL